MTDLETIPETTTREQWQMNFSRRRLVGTMDAVRTILGAALNAVTALTKTWNWPFDIIARQCLSQIARNA
jgi:hypothetical protein